MWVWATPIGRYTPRPYPVVGTLARTPFVAMDEAASIPEIDSLRNFVPTKRIGTSRWIIVPAVMAIITATGCGTTRWTDTSRTGTEQLLISDSAERAISEIDFSVLSGRTVFLDTKYILTVPPTADQHYIISTLRQHLIACGCQIKDKADDADFIVEARTGAIGTNRNELLFGVPATTNPLSGFFPGAPAQIPEIPLAKRTAQQGVCKVAAFAYERKTGHPVWQSGTRQVTSKAKDTWILGTGPWQKGTIYDGTKFAGERLIAPPLPDLTKTAKKEDRAWVAQEIQFASPAPPATAASESEAVAATTGPLSTSQPAATDGKPAPAPATPANHQQQAQPASGAAPSATLTPAAQNKETPPAAFPGSPTAPPIKPG